MTGGGVGREVREGRINHVGPRPLKLLHRRGGCHYDILSFVADAEKGKRVCSSNLLAGVVWLDLTDVVKGVCVDTDKLQVTVPRQSVGTW